MHSGCEHQSPWLTREFLAHMWVGLAEQKMMSISPGGSLPDNDTASRPHQVYLPKLFLVLPLLYFLVHWRLVCSIAVELVLTTCAWIILLKAFSCSRTHSAIFAICWKHGRINSSTSGTSQLQLLKSKDEYSADLGLFLGELILLCVVYTVFLLLGEAKPRCWDS